MRVSVRMPVFILSNVLLSNLPGAAQVVTVDATPSHVVNRFSPLRALGSTVDRVPSNATDVFFRPDQIQNVLSAGWGTISYRQNTDLFVQAWHWNPKGTWSDPAGKGYFTGDKTPTSEMIRHSYGYSLPHRGFTRNGGSEFDGYSRIDDGNVNTYWKSNPYLTSGFTGQERKILFTRSGWLSRLTKKRASMESASNGRIPMPAISGSSTGSEMAMPWTSRTKVSGRIFLQER
jgi:hypothetical protein